MADISTIKIENTSYNIVATPTAHSSTTTTYGKGDASNFGHIKLSDTYTSPQGAATSAIGASATALYNVYNTLNIEKASTSVITWSGNSTATSGFTTNISASTNAFYFLYITVGSANQSGIFYINSGYNVINLYRAAYTISGQKVYISMSVTGGVLKFSVSGGFGGSIYTLNLKGLIIK